MSAEKKPGSPADIPPFLQKKGTASADPAKPAAPGGSKGGDEPSGIPFFLRKGPAAPREQKPVPPPVTQPPLNPPSSAAPSRAATPTRSVPPAPAVPAPAAPSMDMSPPGDLMSPEEVQKALAQAQADRLRAEQDADAERLAFLNSGHEVKAQEPKEDRAGYKPIDWNSAEQIFEHMVSGIRKDRADNKREENEGKRKLETEWQNVVRSMQALQAKVKGNPRVIYFNISRDQREITVKMVDETSRQRSRIMTLTRDHPTGKFKQMEVVWLIEFAGHERYFADPKEAMADLVTSVAACLA
jgi:hypothetical protein